MNNKISFIWRKLETRLRQFPWADAAVRMTADLIFVNVAVLMAILVWPTIHSMFGGAPVGNSGIIPARNGVLAYPVFWSVLALVVFHCNGVYTRTRTYANRYKAWIIFRTLATFVVLLLLGEHLFLPVNLITPGVAALTLVFASVTVGGARVGAEIFFKTYRVEVRRPSTKIRRVLVVGGAGYVGSVLVPQLLAKDYEVRVLDSLLYGPAPLESVQHHGRFRLVQGDVRDIQAVVDAMKDCDAVIDLAAIVGDPACEENRQLAVEVNRAATRMLIDVARGYGVTRFVFASTCSVYGASEFLMDEHSTIAPISTYAQTKADSESLLLEAAGPNFHPVILRLGTLFGMSPRVRFDLVVNLLTARAAMTGKITIFNGNQWRPFLHVADAARAFAMSLEADPALVSKETFNVGDYEMNYRLTEISEMVSQQIPCVEVSHVENGDKRNYRVSFDKIHSRLGFRCERGLSDGIREMYDWIKATGLTDFSAAQFNNQVMMRTFAHSESAERSTLRVLEALSKCA